MNGSGWVLMDSHGCGMDSYGCGGIRGTGVQENKANIDTHGHAVRTCSVRYDRGNYFQKYVRTNIEEGVRMGAAVAAASENSSSSKN